MKSTALPLTFSFIPIKTRYVTIYHDFYVKSLVKGKNYAILISNFRENQFKLSSFCMHFDIIPFSQKLRETNYAKAFLALISRKIGLFKKKEKSFERVFKLYKKVHSIQSDGFLKIL